MNLEQLKPEQEVYFLEQTDKDYVAMVFQMMNTLTIDELIDGIKCYKNNHPETSKYLGGIIEEKAEGLTENSNS